MIKWLLLLLVVVVSPPAALGQSSDYSRYEFYGGYAYQRINNNAAPIGNNGSVGVPTGIVQFDSRDQNYHGFTGEFNQNLNRHWGLVTSFTGIYDQTPRYATSTPVTAKVSRYDLLFGPRYNFRLAGINPFLEAMAGFEHARANIRGAFGTVNSVDTAFAMALGGGLDLHISHHLDIRAIQADYVPTFFNSTHQNNYRLGAGVKVKVVDP
jgi:opacity protein-like surface antigen